MCSSTEMLEFDHIKSRLAGGEKKANISSLLHYSWESLLKELELCQLLCKPCHDRKTAKELEEMHSPSLIKHGVTRYRSGCRCETCVNALTLANKLRREARAARSGKKPSPLPRGVSILSSGRYRASATVNYRTISLGTFDTPDEAHEAYAKFNRTHRPEMDTRSRRHTLVE